MDYSDQQFGRDLLTQLDLGYDRVRIGEWADQVFLIADCWTAVREALIDILAMQEGEEFEIPEDELRERAQRFVDPETA